MSSSSSLARLRNGSVSSRGSSADPLDRLRDKHQLLQVLSTVDDRKEGALSISDFQTGLRMAGVSLNEGDLNQVLSRADPQHSGKINYKEFVEQLRTPKSPAPTTPYSRLSFASSTHMSPLSLAASTTLRLGQSPQPARDTRVFEMLREKVAAKGDVVEKVFRSFASEKPGVLNSDEFHSALKTCGVQLSRSEFDSIVKQVGDYETGSVSVDKVLGWAKYRPDVSPSTPATVVPNRSTYDLIKNSEYQSPQAGPVVIESGSDEGHDQATKAVLEKIRDAVQVRSKYLRKTFRSLDTNHDGVLSREELKTGLGSMGINIAEDDFDRLTNLFDYDHSGEIDYDHFADVIADDSHAVTAGAKNVSTPSRPISKTYASSLGDYNTINHTASPASPAMRARSPSVTQITAKQTLDKLREQVGANYDAVITAFAEVDSGRHGRLHRDNFAEVVRKLDDTVTGEEMFAIANLCSVPDEPEFVDYKALGRLIEAKPGDEDAKSKQRANRTFESGTPDYDILGHTRRERSPSKSLSRPMPTISREQLVADRKILDKIREKVQGKSKRIAKVFRSFDENHDGVVSREEFKRGLMSLGAPLTDAEFGKLLERCDPDRTGEIDYESFAAVVMPPDFGSQEQQAHGSHITARSRHEQQVMSSVRERVAERSHLITKIFRQFDQDHSGTISYDEMKQGLVQLGLALPADDFDMLVDKLDTDHSGHITFDRFANVLKGTDTDMGVVHEYQDDAYFRRYSLPKDRAHTGPETASLPLTPTLKSRRQSVVKDKALVAQIASHFVKEPGAMVRAFKRLDRDYDGKISYSELKRGLADARVVLTDPEFKRFIDLVDRNGDGWVDFGEFASVFAGNYEYKQEPKSPHRSAEEVADLMEKEQVVRKVREKVEQKSSQIQKVFRAFDENRDGTVSREELRKGLHALGAELSDHEFDNLMKVADADNHGSIDYEEFATIFKDDFNSYVMDQHERSLALEEYQTRARRGSMIQSEMGGAIPIGRKSGRRHVKLQQTEIDESIVTRVTQMAHKMPGQLWKSLKRLDRDNDGKISYAEFRRGLCNMKVDLSEAELQRLILQCDKDGDGCIDFNEFISVFGNGDAKDLAAGERTVKLPSDEEHVLTSVREKVARNPRKLEQMLQALDDTSTGSVKPHILRAGLTALGAELNDHDFEKLLAITDPDHTGKVDFDDLKAVLQDSDVAGAVDKIRASDPLLRQFKHMSREQTKSTPASPATSLLLTPKGLARSDNPFQGVVDESIAKRVVDSAKKNPGYLRRCLKRLDQDADGKVTYSEFKRALCDLRIDMPEPDLQRLLNQCDANRDGTIDYNMFCDVFTPSSSRPSSAPRSESTLRATPTKLHTMHAFTRNPPSELERPGTPGRGGEAEPADSPVEAKIFNKVDGRFVSLKKTLASMDASYSGTVTHLELKRALNRFGVELGPQEFAEVIKKADPSGYGYVNFEKFARHYAGREPVADQEERPRSKSTGRLSEYSERFGSSRSSSFRGDAVSPVTRPFRQPDILHMQTGLLNTKRLSSIF